MVQIVRFKAEHLKAAAEARPGMPVLIHRKCEFDAHNFMPHEHASAECWCSPLVLTPFELMAPNRVLDQALDEFYAVH